MTDKYQNTCELISQCEGLKLKAYKCSANKVTIGCGTICYPNGLPVKITDTCTKEQAFAWLNDHLKRFIYPVVERLQVQHKFNDSIFSALCSLAYNIGAALSGRSILAALKSSDIEQLAAAFRKYILVDGLPSNGLKNRREIEIKYFKGK